MTTYAEYKIQIEELHRQAEVQREAEVAAVKDQIRTLMANYGLTLADLGPAKSKARKERAPVPVKYRDDTTGETWTGRGRAPKWLDGKDKADYLIK